MQNELQQSNADEAPPFVRPIDSPPDVLIGAIIGTSMGAALGLLSCWLLGKMDSGFYAGVIGAASGLIVGGILGVRHQKKRINRVNSDIGTTICTFYPILPTMLIMASGAGALQGKFLLAAFFVGPMVGMLIGSVVDRLYESLLRRRERSNKDE